MNTEAKLCKFCGHLGKPKRYYPGSRGMEMFLWTTLLIPGPFYSWWRRKYSHFGCSECGSTNLVNADSPEAKSRRDFLREISRLDS